MYCSYCRINPRRGQAVISYGHDDEKGLTKDHQIIHHCRYFLDMLYNLLYHPFIIGGETLMPEEKRSLKVFLCYAHNDHEVVHKLHNRLKRDGVDVWFDEKKLLGGANWEYEIRKAVRENDVIIVCLSSQCNPSGFRQKEVEIALNEAALKPQEEIFVIPVRLEDCDVPEQLKIRQWVDLFRRGGYLKLMESLNSRAAQLQRTVVELPKPNEAGPGPVEESRPAQTHNVFVNVGGNVQGNITIGDQNDVLASTVQPPPEKPAEIEPPAMDEKEEPKEQLKPDEAKNIIEGGNIPKESIVDKQNAVPTPIVQPAPKKPVETKPPVVVVEKKEQEKQPVTVDLDLQLRIRYALAKIGGVGVVAIAVIIACLVGIGILTQLAPSVPVSTATSTPTPIFTDTPTLTDTSTPTDTPILTDTPTLTGIPTLTDIPTPTNTPTLTGTPTFTPTNTAIPTFTKAPTATQYPSVYCSWTEKEQGKKVNLFLNYACICQGISCTCDMTRDWFVTPSPEMGDPPYIHFSRIEVNDRVLQYGGSCHQ
jgi:ribosomal protein S8